MSRFLSDVTGIFERSISANSCRWRYWKNARATSSFCVVCKGEMSTRMLIDDQLSLNTCVKAIFFIPAQANGLDCQGLERIGHIVPNP